MNVIPVWIVATLLALLWCGDAPAQNVLASFDGDNGQNPWAGVVLSRDGSVLYGTTLYGGAYTNGTVFSVPVGGGPVTTLVSFDQTNGANPMGRLIVSADGSTLYGTTSGGGAYTNGTVFSIPVEGGTVTTLATFNGTNGANPCGGVILSADGSTLYGTTESGGAFTNCGTVFSVPLAGGAVTTLASFNGTNGANPYTGVILSEDGATLYGTTHFGGTNNIGSVFSVPAAGGPVTTLASFNIVGTRYPNGGNPYAGLLLVGSTLYGATYYGAQYGYGTLFSVPAAGGPVTTLAVFNGSTTSHPTCDLVLVGSTLYGTTYWGGSSNVGTIFSLPVGGGPLNTLLSFNGSNGANALAGLIVGGSNAFGTTLYGTTSHGGASGYGTVFELVLSPTATVLGASSVSSNYGDSVTFSATLQTNGGTAVNATGDYLFLVDGRPIATNALSAGQAVFTTSMLPIGSRTITAQYLGDRNYLPSTTSLTQTVNAVSPGVMGLAWFDGANGAKPRAGLLLNGSTLYGTTWGGGAAGYGTVFSSPVGGGPVTTLVSFDHANGANPFAGLILSADGSILYGTTQNGGASTYGTVFSIPVGGGPLTTLASFNYTNGANPRGELLLIGSTLYGTTYYGGAYGHGTAFSLPAAGGPATALISFNKTNGANPCAGLLLNGSTLYGTTYSGGASGYGTVFSLPVTGGPVTTLASFNNANGGKPYAGLLLNGTTLYGTTYSGGASGHGTVFSLPIGGGPVTTLTSFDNINGANPYGGLLLIGSTLYGTATRGGTANNGTVYSLPVSGGDATVLGSFIGASGANPYCGLILSGSTLYGTTQGGGLSGDGTVFELLLSRTTTTLGTSGSPSTYGDSVTFTSAVQTNGVTAGNATGNYVFILDGTAVVTNAVKAGTATYTASLLMAGSHTVTAEYSGDANYLPSTNSVIQTVNPLGSPDNPGGQVAGMALHEGTVTMTFVGVPGYTYNVQVSTNLASWTTLWTTNTPPNGVFHFDHSNTPQPAAYYRLLSSVN